MRYLGLTAVYALLLLSATAAGFCQQPSESDTGMAKNEIIAKLESRYGGTNIAADFVQQSTLEAMDITDTATGRVWFKHPGMMRWAYDTPDAHAIITDGETLWIHRPADNQVIVGDALTYFGNGKGASFLSNIQLIKKAFTVEKVPAKQPGHYTLKLIPRKKELDISKIFLNINRKTFIVDKVSTRNAYGDETLIEFNNVEFKDTIKDAKFQFEIPPGADVVQLEQ